MRCVLMAGAAFLAMVGPALAQDAVLSIDNISQHIRILSDDSFEGRAPGTAGETKTLEYLTAQYAALGLEPGGENGGWLQPVDLLSFLPSSAPQIALLSGDVRTALDGGSIRLATGQGSGQVDVRDAPLIFVGFGIHAPELGWDDLAGADLTGKIVVYLAGEPDDRSDKGLFEGHARTNHGRGGTKNAQYLARGAVGAISFPATAPPVVAAPAGAPASPVVAPTPPPRPYIRLKSEAPQLQFSGSMRGPAVVELFNAQGLDLSALQAQAAAGPMTAAPIGNARLSIKADYDVTPIRSYNFVARLPGRTRPDETVLFSAHWDHLGVAATPDANGDSIYNGAWDNASGTGALIELARLFAAGPRPERSVVFLSVTAEESGLLGSQWYAEHPIYPLATTAANFNMDMIPLTTETRDVEIIGFGKSTLEDDLIAALTADGRVAIPDTHPEEGFYYRSDHVSFAEKGVPALYFDGGSDLIVGGREAGVAEIARLNELFYHELDDEWRPDLNLGAARQNLTLTYELARDLANSRRWPEWKEGVDFGVIRAQTADQRR
ncbi:MAG: M28 family peptidase [Brevundimonas sp.]|uniref:M28 family metallopeptidase n=1 Tax=Brevundimonas sp. TaxID=1871086 RepID=UPI00122692F9|nr:M28 family peptidase [Brevundimonas sp.]RZJ16381.1 MAG: M28 family peptidase [Brevundimonas sp.]